MEKKDLDELKIKISNLSINEKKLRDLYLRDIALGKVQGPMTGYASIDKPWLKFFEPKQIGIEVPKKSIYQNMMDTTKNFNKKTALEYFGVKISYKKFKKEIDKAAKSLIQMGVKPGDVVSVCLPNTPEVAYIFYAINKIGAVANMLDVRTNESNLVSSVNDAKSDIVISLDSVCEKFLNCNAKHVVSVSAINTLPKLIQKIVKKKKPALNVKLPDNPKLMGYNQMLNIGKKYRGKVESVYKPNQPAVIASTGGTTGVPKGVIMTNEAFNSMIIENSVEGYNMDQKDKLLNLAPPWTYYGLSNCLNAFLCLGITSILVPEVDPDGLGELIAKHKPNHIITVPSALVAPMKDKLLEGMALDFIKTIIVGADKLDETFEKKFNKFLKEHNCNVKITKGYGMTEVCAAATYTKNDEVNKPGTVGIPYVLENIAIFDPETKEELPYGSQGEIGICGPKNMVGYFGENAHKTDDVLKVHDDGSKWIHTGDIGHIDINGKLFIDGRLKRMFVKGGFKIFPGEIERQILKNESVSNAAVISVPDQTYGLKTKAFITVNEGIDETIISVINKQLLESLYDYELPDEIEIIDKLPLTGMNKINFKALEEREKQKTMRL